MMLASVIVMVVAAYALVGALFATWFVLLGVGRLDPTARAGTWGFRLMIWPGSAALWPLLAAKIARERRP